MFTSGAIGSMQRASSTQQTQQTQQTLQGKPTHAELTQASRDIIHEVKNMLPNGAGNTSTPKAPQGIVRKLIDQVRKDSDIFDDSTLNGVIQSAYLAVAAKSGNCGENAMIAFSQAFRKGIFPIEIFYYPRGQGDHAFAVFGREPDDPGNSPGVICDPWGNYTGDFNDIVKFEQTLWTYPGPSGTPTQLIRVDRFFSDPETHYRNVTEKLDGSDIMDMSFAEGDERPGLGPDPMDIG